MGLDVEVGVKDARFKSGLAQLRSQARQFSGSITGMLAGAFSIAGISSFASKMREVQNSALRFGTTAETIQRVGKAARDSDVDFDMLARAVNKVTLEATKAARGSTEVGKRFRDLGIDATKFVSLGLDQKILVLSRAFEQSRGSGMGTAAMLELLGNRGGEIIPLLAQGPNALSRTMREASVQTNNTVKAFSDLDRAIQKINGGAGKALGWAVSKWQSVVAHVTAEFDDSYEDAARAKLKEENDRRKKQGQPQMTGPYARFWVGKKANELRKEAVEASLKEVNAPKTETPQPVNDFEKDADNAKKAALLKQIEEARNRNRADAMTGEARINELMEQRKALADQINETTVEGLEAKKQDLDLERQIEQAQRQLDKDVTQAQKSELSVLEKRYLDKASPKEKKQYLQDKQSRLMDESKEAAKAGDSVKSIQKRTEAESLQDDIDQAGEKKKDKRVTVAVDSLQRVGGGGGIGPSGDQAVRQRDKTNDLLSQIRALIASQGQVIVRDASDGDY